MVVAKMGLNSAVFVVMLVGSAQLAAAETNKCPGSHNKNKSNLVVGARLFDGVPSDQVELVPDNEKKATWDIRGYKSTDRQIYMVCDYKDGASTHIRVSKSSNHCRVSGRKNIAAWCYV